ncbi:hypothetical protein [Planobispora longispora]|uniref:Uncharacterized protein n=1 Tax=Planobispora longispora TaxID=28887 RepID=A0A8J3RDQ0_9ACTN|nr:hypothetical protein [Planobispora longispora]BFE77752.1 hypothetical protein GCM10020093_003530 [Planobispora longispora]GIH73807.1 hypothetical protein Plo01_02360 [Planobispora longispora]
MIRRILAGAAIAGFASLAFAGPAAADHDWDRWDRGHGNYIYIDDSNHNEVLNDLFDFAFLGIIEN